MAKRTSNKNDSATKSRTKKSNSDKDNRSNGQGGNGVDPGSAKSAQISKEEALKALRLMLLGRTIDNKAMNLLRQGRTFFHIAGSGHEAIQVAAGLALKS